MSKIDKLHAMVNRSWQHTDGLIYRFLSINVDGDECTIATDSKWLKEHVYNLNTFFEQLTEVEVMNNEVTVIQKDVPTQKRQDISVMKKDTMEMLRDTLLESIERVKKDPGYIPQAHNISSSVNSIIGLAKIEIDIRTKI